ncbi:glycosyltransferase [Isoptericola sp. NPDC057653]|uniref:glycosyltransferase n=1 Tax=unclassified Isoptericola TaxID=2623355 RepID=UPI00368328F9
MTALRPRRGPRPDEVVMFVRTLAGSVAGGTRAVLARANAYAAAGHPTTLVVTSVVPDGGEWARRSGLLDPRVRLRHFWRDGPGTAEHRAAAGLPPLAPPRVADGAGVVRRRRVTAAGERWRTTVDGVLRTQELRDPATGEVLSFVTYADDGGRDTVWTYVDGRVATVDRLDRATGGRVREFVVDGRLVWLTAHLTGPEGTGAVTYALGGPGRGGPLDLAGALAAWLDGELADRGRVVVVADGENVWQRTLRLLTHPGVRGVSVLHNSHLAPPYGPDAPTKEHWRGYFDDLRNVHAMVCLTGRQHEDLSRRYPGLPLRVVHHAAERPDAGGATRDPRTVVFVGRLAPQKQLDHLLRAFVLVRRDVPDARLDLYGDGPLDGELRALAADLGLGTAVAFRGRTDAPLRAFAAARVAAMTSLHEGLPLTLTEGMSVGTPFVAYDCCYGPAEVLRDGENGFLVAPGDVEGFAARLVAVLQDDALARRLGRRARGVRRELGPRRYRRAWLDVLDDVLAAPTTPR